MTHAAIDLVERVPPDTLYHAADAVSATAILTRGLEPDARHHVRLSADPETARRAVEHDGKPVVFTVYARAAHDDGQPFWMTESGVWLTRALAADFLYLPPVRGAE
ncbi:RNA 2'-phosphotransferase [Actibacterium ureilyticum]|uniref:RNA 2'-phosphotransferase n=1 Tax=Actibacterium ureilyticum TaxID=1590614 RepID=UPI000BAB1F5D|nr:RNA 2'-phosphotransferase [Actibacterium ureilyticum]